MRRLIVDDLISDVRSLLDEDNSVSVNDDRDILPALCRAQEAVVNILCRNYNDPFLAYKTLQPVSGTSEYEIPEDAFEERLEKVEVNRLGLFYEVKRIDFRDITAYENSNQQNIPYYYCIVGDKIRFVPVPAAAYPLRIWYIKAPEQFVKQQGRISLVNAGSNYVTLDNPGADLSTQMDDLNSYVNLVDGHSGTIKATMQIQNVQGQKIYFKTSPTRSSVLGKSVVGSIPATVEQDDYLCLAAGTCVPRFKQAVSNYLIQFAVADIVRKLGGSVEIEEKVKADFEKFVEKQDHGRETSTRVRKVNRNWAIISRRFYPS